MPEPTDQCAAGCQTCGLWKREEKPARGESAEYLTFRRCADYLRPGLRGRHTLNARGQVLTAPEASCRHHLPMTGGGGER